MAKQFSLQRINTAICLDRMDREKIVTPVGSSFKPSSKQRIDNSHVRALATAFRWRKLLEEGTCTSVLDIARSE